MIFSDHFETAPFFMVKAGEAQTAAGGRDPVRADVSAQYADPAGCAVFPPADVHWFSGYHSAITLVGISKCW